MAKLVAVVDPPFMIALRLSAEVSRGPITLADLEEAVWRSRLRPLAYREPSAHQFAPGEVPSQEDASGLLDRSFAEHPMVNVSRRLRDGSVEHDEAPMVQAIVTAEVVLRPELVPIPPGGEYPLVGDGTLTEPYVVHAMQWSHQPGSKVERFAAQELLQTVVANLPEGLWRLDD